MVAGEGFEPSKAEPGDLQSPPIGRSGNPPGSYKYYGALVVRAANDTLGAGTLKITRGPHNNG